MQKPDRMTMPRYSLGEILKVAVILICVSSFPPLYIFAHNVDIAAPGDLIFALVAISLISLMVTALIALLARDLHIGTIITTAIVTLFFSYGHIYLLLANSKRSLLNFFGKDIVLFPVWSAILILVIFLAFRFRHVLQRVMSALLAFGIVLVAPLLFQIGSFIVQNDQNPSNSPAEQTTSGQQPTNAPTYQARVNPLPDVYYIILDGYARADVLKQNFNYDNSEFIQALEQRGFYVADQSFTNYPVTSISISSSLNMEYHDISQFDGKKKSLGAQYRDLIMPDKVVDVLTSLGYGYYSNRTPMPGTPQAAAQSDPFLISDDSEFFYILSKSSFVGVMDRVPPDLLSIGSAQGTGGISFGPPNQIERKLATLPQFADDHVPTFIYGHFISPHPPYKFTRSIYEGEADSMDSNPWMDHDAYVRETQGLNRAVLKTIDEILARSETPPIIIIQSDHGPGAKLFENGLSWKSPAGALAKKMPEDVRFERFAILNAYYGPPEMLKQLYPSISPVNSFRVVLSYLTDEEFPLLPDRSFLATYKQPVEFVEFPELHKSIGQ